MLTSLKGLKGSSAPKPVQKADGKPAAAPTGSLFAKVWPFNKKKKTSAAQRRFKRHSCFVIGMLRIVDKHVELDGLVTEISQGGLLFRTASTYILFRLEDEVTVSFNNRTFPGKIVATRDTGYGVKLNDLLPEEFVEEVASHYGVMNEQFSARPTQGEAAVN
jgi:hypothetical protein